MKTTNRYYMQHVLALYVRSVPKEEDATTIMIRHQCFARDCTAVLCQAPQRRLSPHLAARPSVAGGPHPHGSLPAVLTHGVSRRPSTAESADYGNAIRQVAGLSGPQRRARVCMHLENVGSLAGG